MEDDQVLFQVTVQLNSWALADATIVMTIPAGGELNHALEALRSPAIQITPLGEAA